MTVALETNRDRAHRLLLRTADRYRDDTRIPGPDMISLIISCADLDVTDPWTQTLYRVAGYSPEGGLLDNGTWTGTMSELVDTVDAILA